MTDYKLRDLRVSHTLGWTDSFVSFIFLGVPTHYVRRSLSCWYKAYSRVRGCWYKAYSRVRFPHHAVPSRRRRPVQDVNFLTFFFFPLKGHVVLPTPRFLCA